MTQLCRLSFVIQGSGLHLSTRTSHEVIKVVGNSDLMGGLYCVSIVRDQQFVHSLQLTIAAHYGNQSTVALSAT